MLEKIKLETFAASPIHFRLLLKLLLGTMLMIVVVLLCLYNFFLPELSKSKIDQVKEMANSTSIIVRELALSSFYKKDQTHIVRALKESITKQNAQNGGFSQISVILYPSGIYYASTNEDFQNKRVGQSLLNKIEMNTRSDMVVEKLNYEIGTQTIPVLQFLRNVTVKEKGEETRVAVVQILFDYGQILDKTKRELFVVGGIVFLSVLLLTWLIYFPTSRAHRKLKVAFEQIGQKNFEYTLKTSSHDEIGSLYAAFNRMRARLQDYFVEKRESSVKAVLNNQNGSLSGLSEIALRKTELTCLCARIPGIQELVEEDSPDAVAEAIAKFLEPFEKIVHEYGGQVIKILGDKAYTVFEGINSIDNSIRTALRINRKWQTQNHENKVLDKGQLNFGLGLHSTEGIAGTVGHTSLSYTVIGKAVGIAEYLCSCAKREEILISSSMMDKANGAYQHRVLTNLKPSDLSETEEFLLITNMYSGESESREVLAGQTSELARATSPEQGLVSANGEQKTAFNGALPIPSRHSFDTSITDMLEETLSTAPLESITDAEEKKNDEERKRPNGKKEDSLDEKSTLWDTFDSDAK